MTDDPQLQKILEVAAPLRADDKVADELHGALETLYEKVRDDAVVATSLPKCARFRRLLKQLHKEVDPVLSAKANGEPPPADFNPAKAQATIEEWQSARIEFHDDYRKHREYLEKLALRIFR